MTAATEAEVDCPPIGGPGLCPAWAANPADPAPAGDQLVDVATEPLVVWFVIVSACAAILLRTLSGSIPPAVEAWGRMRETRRRDRQRGEDARILDLSEQVDHLAGRVWTLEQDKARHSEALIRHAAWDQALIHAAIAAGVAVHPPPPLYPTPPTPPHHTTAHVEGEPPP